MRSQIAALVAAAVTLQLAAGLAFAAQDFGGPVSGETVYDTAGALSSSERASVEDAETALSRNGTPTIVYLRLRSASPASTQADAAELMDAWNVQSSPGAHDGVVLFVNLRPSDPRHGDAAFTWVSGCWQDHCPNLNCSASSSPTWDLSCRVVSLGKPLWDGLYAVRFRISAQPPGSKSAPDTSSEGFWRDAAVRAGVAVGANGAAILLLVLAIPWMRREWDRRPHQRPARYSRWTFEGPPGRLSPAMAGALVLQRLDNALMVATILDLTRRGELSLDPRTDGSFRLRLVHEPARPASFEKQLWSALESVAVQNIIESADIPDLALAWRPAIQELEAELRRRGWFQADDPNLPWVNRWSAAGYLLAVAASVVAMASGQPEAVPGIAVLYSVGVLATLLGLSAPVLTSEGAAEAAPWRAYRQWLARAARDLSVPLELERELSYAVAFGLGRDFGRRIAAEDEVGGLPEWLESALPTGKGEGAWLVWWDGSFGGSGTSGTGWSGVSGDGGGAAAGGGGAATGF